MSPRPPRHHPSADALLAFAGGQADPALRLLVEAHLEACDACAAETGSLGQPGGAFLASLPPAPVPADLFARILAGLPSRGGVDEAYPSAVSRLLPPPPARRWRGVLKRGIRFLELLDASTARASLYLLHLRDGAAFPHHRHPGLEDAVILAGGAVDGALDLEPGDWRHMDPGSAHAPRAKPGEDCWFLVRVEGGVAFQGWRRLVPGG
ncbi:MAG: cupin domain-containing protein [Holophagaceae bacterium]